MLSFSRKTDHEAKMASQTVSPPTAAEEPKKTLTEAEIRYNGHVGELQQTILKLSLSVKNDMKVRQLPEKLAGDKVYGPDAANRTDINSFVSHIKKTSDVVGKLAKGLPKKTKTGFIGFSVPGYITREMALAIGLREGESGVLWPQGGQPIFSAGLLTSYFMNHGLVHGLVHKDDISVFRADDKMRALWAPYTVSSRKKPEDPPINLDAITHPDIQQLNKNFIVPRNKTKPGPNLNEATPDGKVLVDIFKGLGLRFKELGKLKDEVKALIVAAANAEQQAVKAKACLDRGQITPLLFQSVAYANKEIQEKKERVYASYRAMAAGMGI